MTSTSSSSRVNRARLLLADGQVLVSQGLAALLAKQFQVVSMIHDGLAVMGAVRHHRPDVVLLDLVLPNRNGLEICREITHDYQSIKVIVVSVQSDKVYVEESFKSGAVGFVSKCLTAGDLITAVETVLTGGTYRKPEAESQGRSLLESLRVVQRFGAKGPSGVDPINLEDLSSARDWL